MTFMKPERRITTSEDLSKWVDSKTYTSIVSFIQDLQQSVEGKTNDEKVDESDITTKVLVMLDNIERIFNENPVVQDKNISRFGKVEFRDFYDQVGKESEDLIKPLVQDNSCIIELLTYLQESWGNRTRIDYGSGHELNFICFLLCLKNLGILQEKDYCPIILKGFTKYMKIMRELQKQYWLEPAGSHGVWGLDDYHFLPFLFGASQLATHPYMKPKLIHNEELVDLYYKQYMYFECIHFINAIKTVPNNQEKLSIRWHSPMLDDISSAKSWIKIKEGMIKMYKAEVLGKLPIIQHFMFGTLIECPEGISEYQEHDESDDCGHDHGQGHDVNNTWGDCCGIKIPSAIAASELLKKQLRVIPFD